MDDHDEETPQPLFKRWQLVLLTVFLLFVCAGAVVVYRNQQSWNRARKFSRQMEAAGAEPDIIPYYISDFCPGYFAPRDGRHSAISWAMVQAVDLNRRTDLTALDWSQAPRVYLRYVFVSHPDFSDQCLAAIPDDTPLEELRIDGSAVTNASIDKIKRFTKLRSIYTIGSKIDGAGLMRLVGETTASLNADITPKGLEELAAVNALQRVHNFALQSNHDFAAVKLKGISGDGVFQGKYGATAFSGISAVYSRGFLKFDHADLSAESLSDLAQIKNLRVLRFSECVLRGSVDCSPNLPSSAAPVEVEEDGSTYTPSPASLPTLIIFITKTKFDPTFLKCFTDWKIEVNVYGDAADDAWLHAIMKIPGVEQVNLHETSVSEEAMATYDGVDLPEISVNGKLRQ